MQFIYIFFLQLLLELIHVQTQLENPDLEKCMIYSINKQLSMPQV